MLKEKQKVYVAGGFKGEKRNKCFSVTHKTNMKEEFTLFSNAEETDLRIWLHCLFSPGTKKLLYSRDTDVYIIGLTLLSKHIEKLDVFVQQSPSLKVNAQFVCLTQFLQALHNDPDMACIPKNKHAQAIQAIYACTGCDYISYFKGMSKSFFLTVFYQYAYFISSDSKDLPGHFGDLDMEPGLMAFLRLIGCAYFKKHISGFTVNRPDLLYFSLQKTSAYTQHKQWLDKIRETIWDRVLKEEHALPSTEALCLHWKHCLWVLTYWRKSQDHIISMPG